MHIVELAPASAGPVVAGHPWVFAQAVARVTGTPAPGDEVLVREPRGRIVGRGLWSPDSAIVVRIATHEVDQPLDDAWLRQRIATAVALRTRLGLPSSDTTGYRLVNSEGDGIPGVTVDVYGDVLSIQVVTVGMQKRLPQLVEALQLLLSPRAIVEVASPKAQAREGVLVEAGTRYGEAPSAFLLRERGIAFELRREGLQKTGYYFDQREHRARLEGLVSGARVLDACCYVGGFALPAARAGAKSVLALDSSEPALALGARNADLNGLADRIEFRKADVRQDLRARADAGERFDVVVLDPPKLVPSVKNLERGRVAYRQLNRNAMRLLEPGGLLVTCSCSAAMTQLEFSRCLSLAARDAGRELAIVHVGGQGPDHPVPPGFPEGQYLKTVFAFVH